MAFTSVLSTLFTVAGAVVGGIQAVNASRQQEQNEKAAAAAARYQADVAKVNANITRQNAARAIAVSQIEQQESDIGARGLIGEQIAQQAASGLALGGKSAIATRKSAKLLARKDALNIRYAGEVEKSNYLTEAMNQEAQRQMSLGEAQAHDQAAKNAHKAAGLSLLATFFDAGSSLVGSSKPYNRARKKFSGTPTPVERPYGLAATI